MMDPELQNEKRRYLDNEVLTLTIQGAHSTRGVPVYTDNRHSEPLKQFVRCRLPELGSKYRGGSVSDLKHIQNIEGLANDLTAHFHAILHGQKFRIGISQKLLNLYLKYQWVLGWIPEPPHCLFDFVVIRKLKLPQRISWTEMDSREDYLILVNAVRKIAQHAGLSIASWELREWSGPSGRGTTSK
ncbi:MAG: hypothetical protein HY234_10280 [Acidobacteria bacterium]|nr:hypothetical protein [Acidobacteriota bacterium]